MLVRTGAKILSLWMLTKKRCFFWSHIVHQKHRISLAAVSSAASSSFTLLHIAHFRTIIHVFKCFMNCKNLHLRWQEKSTVSHETNTLLSARNVQGHGFPHWIMNFTVVLHEHLVMSQSQSFTAHCKMSHCSKKAWTNYDPQSDSEQKPGLHFFPLSHIKINPQDFFSLQDKKINFLQFNLRLQHINTNIWANLQNKKKNENHLENAAQCSTVKVQPFPCAQCEGLRKQCIINESYLFGSKWMSHLIQIYHVLEKSAYDEQWLTSNQISIQQLYICS